MPAINKQLSYGRETVRRMLQWVTLMLNCRMNSYVSQQYLRIVRCGNRYSTTLPLHVFTQNNFAADSIPLKLIIFLKNKK